MIKMDLEEKIVIITGGSGLLGKQYIEAVKEINGTPIVIDIQEPDEPLNCKAFYADITNEKEMYEVLRILKIVYDKPIYGLVNNAALNPTVGQADSLKLDNSLGNYDLEQFRKEIDVGITGSFICTKVFGGEMIKNRSGSIINIASILGVVAPNEQFYSDLGVVKPCGYTVSKHAIVGLTRHTGVEWARYGVRCNCLVLGGVFNNHSDQFLIKLSKMIPMCRMANKSEYNSKIQFLLTEASSYMTGSILTADGGFTAQ